MRPTYAVQPEVRLWYTTCIYYVKTYIALSICALECANVQEDTEG